MQTCKFYLSKKTESMSYKKGEPKIIILNSQSKVLSTKLSDEMLLLSLTQVFGLTKDQIVLSPKRKSDWAKQVFYTVMIKIISLPEPTQIQTQLKCLPTWEAMVGIQVPLVLSLRIKKQIKPGRKVILTNQMPVPFTQRPMMVLSVLSKPMATTPSIRA